MFLGKWTCGQGGQRVVVNASSGVLQVAAPPTDRADRLNADGTTQAFTLQSGLTGKYVVLANGVYAAAASTTATAHWFTFRAAGEDAALLVVDLGLDPSRPGDSGASVWTVSGGGVVPGSGVDPPPAARFDQSIVTVGLSDILKNGIATEPDLAWADLHGVDFTKATDLIVLNQADLTHTDLSGAIFPSGVGFEKAIAPGVDLRGATVPHGIFGHAILTHAHLDDAHLHGIDLSYADLTGATLLRARLTSSINMAHAVFDGAVMTEAVLTDSANIYGTSFVGATLVGVDFSGSSVTGTMNLSHADLTGATLNNPVGGITIYPGKIVVDAQTTMARAKIQRLDLSGYDLRAINFAGADLTGCHLSRCRLDGANLGYAILDDTALTGGVALHGANLSSASLRRADLTGAQLGAVGEVFRIGQAQPAYDGFHAALTAGDSVGVAAAFASMQYSLTAPIGVRASTYAPDTSWAVQGGGTSQTFSVALEKLGATSSLTVYQPTSPAVLSNAFLVDANLKGANLYGVRASGAQIYATAGRTVNLNHAIIEGLQANNANLGRVDLSQAGLAGVNFDYAVLTGADLTGATISVGSTGGQPSFNGTNLQGADFTGATMRGVILSNAAVAVANPRDSRASAGVWLFSLPPDQAGIVAPQLEAASAPFTVPVGLVSDMGQTGPVPKGVVAAFAKAKITLSDTALLAVLTVDTFWRITDGSNADGSNADGSSTDGATPWVVFRTVDNNYRPALGVAAGTTYTIRADFFLPLSVLGALGNGAVAASVRVAFAAAGHPLAGIAAMTTSVTPSAWQVIDGPTTYTLWLSFSSSIRGVDTTIKVRPAIATVVSSFGVASVSLSAVSTVTALEKGGWRISNDAENPFSAARGYIEFTALPNGGGGLDVYGSMIRIVRTSAPGRQEFLNIPCVATVVPRAALSADGATICPNGASVAANTASGLPYDEWFRARFLASPPFCVPDPDGNFSCPT